MGQSASGPVHETAATFGPNEEKYLSIDSCGFEGFVTITSNSTISNVRQQVLDEFDEDMLPPTKQFYFTVDGKRLSRKQESNKAYMLLNRKVSLCGLSVDATTTAAAASSESGHGQRRIHAEFDGLLPLVEAD